MTMAQGERTFLSDGGVTVTQARFMVPGQTYAMSGVTSVKSLVESPSRKGPLAVMAFGILVLLSGAQSGAGGVLLGMAIAGIGGLWWYLQKPKYIVVLHSASGESRAYVSADGGLVGRIVSALNDAIVARG